MADSTVVKLVRNLGKQVAADARVPDRVKAVNSLLNGGYDLKILTERDIDCLWEALFFAAWSAEMGRGFEEITAAIARACSNFPNIIQSGFRVIAAKWYGLDHYRVDKISHLTRHLTASLFDYQLELWLRTVNKNKNRTGKKVNCKLLIKQTIEDTSKSYGMRDFLLEIFAEELNKSLYRVYNRFGLLVGHQVLKSKLLIFIYNQLIHYCSEIKMDGGLVRSFDSYIFKQFIELVLMNETQVCQIFVTLRLAQLLKRVEKKKSNELPGSNRKFLKRWSKIFDDMHESCMNGELFPLSKAPKLR